MESRKNKMSSGISSGHMSSASDENQIQCNDVIVKEEDEWCKDLEFDSNLLKIYKEENDIDEAAINSGTPSPDRCDLKKILMCDTSTNTGVKIFACTLCNKEYKSLSSFKQHIVSHNVNGTCKCELCDKQFHWNCSLKEHVLTHTKDIHDAHMMSHDAIETYKCELCNEQFHWKAKLRIHKLKCTNDKPFTCTLCNIKFESKNYHNAHMMSHHAGSFKCQECNKQFRRMSRFAIHMLTHTTNKPVGCTLCNKLYKNKLSSAKHMLSHSAEIYFKCEVCHEKFKLRHSLMSHMRTHENEAAP